MNFKATAFALIFQCLSVPELYAQTDTASPLMPPVYSPAIPTTPQAKQFRLGDLRITGNTHTKLFVIMRMIPLVQGEIFNQSLWDYGLDQLNRSGLFEQITQNDVVMRPNQATGLIDIELHLKERDHQHVDLSGGGGTTGGTSVSLDYTNWNLTGRADRLTGRLRLGTRERAAGLTLSTMSYRRLPVSFDFSGFFERLEFVNANTIDQGREPLFVERTAGGSIGGFVPLSKSRFTMNAVTRVGIVYTIASTNLADALASNITTTRSLEQGGLRTASLTALLLHNTLDRDLDPVHGQSLRLSAEVGGRALGGSLNSFKPSLDYRRFWSLGRQTNEDREPTVIGVRLRASHVRAFGERFSEDALSTVNGVPIFRRSFVGGETEVRGYDINSIAPLARVDRFLVTGAESSPLLSSEVRPIGGDTEVIFNTEYRVPIVWRISSAAFLDIGTSFNAGKLQKESFETSIAQTTGPPVTLLTVLKPLKPGQDFLPSYRASLGGEIRFSIPALNIPLRFIFAWNPNAQKDIPAGALIAPEKRFTFRLGFSRTL